MKDELEKIKVEHYQQMIKDLKLLLNTDLVKLDTFYEKGIVFQFNNGYKLFISPYKSDRPGIVSSDGLMVIYDFDYINLSKILYKQPIKLTHENGSSQIYYIFQAYKKESFYDIEKQMINYKNIHTFELKDLLRTFLRLPLNPQLEYFLYGNDELSPRYNKKQKIKVTAKGISIRIQDKSTYVFESEDGLYVDLLDGLFYKDSQYVYLDRNLTQLVECQESDIKDDDQYFVSYNSNGDKKYLKSVLKEGADLSQVKKLKYYSIDNQEFLLKKDKENTYYLQQGKKKFRISHPDLLIYVLEGVEINNAI